MSTTFVEADHPRETSGRFGRKVNSSPTGSLEPEQSSQEARVAELQSEFLGLWSDRTETVNTELDSAGETSAAQEVLAAVTRDPRVLAVLAGNTIGGVDEAVARNPHTPAPVLHAIAADTSASRAYTTRFLAATHPNTSTATICHLYDGDDPDEKVAAHRAFMVDLACAPNAPGNLLTDMVTRGNPIAGRHPNLPEHTRRASVSDPNRAHLVIENGALTDEELNAALEAVTPMLTSDDEDDQIHAALVGAGVAKHPNTSDATLTRLETQSDRKSVV